MGVIYKPDGSLWWSKTHAAIPTLDLMKDDILRIYFGTRDKKNVSRIGYIDVEAKNPKNILNVSKKPILNIGRDGTFDDNGVLPSSIVNYNKKKFLYYIGFQLGVKVKYFLFSGLAINYNNSKIYKKYSNVPILERSDEGLFFRTAPFVLIENNIWKMWYVEGNKWINIKGKQKPVYRIKYNESIDGIHWKSNGVLCLDFKSKTEYGFGRPYVIKDRDKYKMFYSIRYKHVGYRLGYAESKDGINWVRKDEDVGIDVSENGWDSEMICFSSIYKINGEIYMFYNGNNFGETGIGYAKLIH